MARTNISVAQFDRTGVALTATAGDVTNGNSIPNDGSTGLVVTNTGATSHTLTVAITKKVDGQGVTAKTWTLTAGAVLGIGPFPVDEYSAKLQVNADNAELTILPVRV